ncbi:hypothetical protein BC936DRAFT_138119 [Jimgerdemannia flammicorona]|uniref:Cysteine protease n=1 Tax=Jimgerdemannia flammicorona TaxID=994334 RepID=A0A433CW75_9FUNG|nr:hypothetical protein BC936DRAFT_138119 [Jimgerdemannia flammicorona]
MDTLNKDDNTTMPQPQLQPSPQPQPSPSPPQAITSSLARFSTLLSSARSAAANAAAKLPPVPTNRPSLPTTLPSLPSMSVPNMPVPNISMSQLSNLFSRAAVVDPPKEGETSSPATAAVIEGDLSTTDPVPPFSFRETFNQNNNIDAHITDILRSNSAYLAAEIPNKIGHWVNSFWGQQSYLISGSDATSSSDNALGAWKNDSDDERPDGPAPIWLLGVKYEIPKPVACSETTTSPVTDTAAPPLEPPVTSVVSGEDSPPTPSAPPLPDSPTALALSLSMTAPPQQQQHPWPDDFYLDFCSRLWFTYRHNYPPIRPASFTTDIGWGCMLRSGQSLLSNALVLHFLGRGWRRGHQGDATWKRYTQIVNWFLDELAPRSPFSIHRIALLGKLLGKNIGEWFGPSTTSQVIKTLVTDYPAADLTVAVATDGVVYRNEVYEAATAAVSGSGSGSGSDAEPDLHKHKEGEWRPVLILVAIRLGIDQLNPIYYPALKAYFEFPWSVGIAGGRPNSSLYFVGVQGDELFYLDPHFSRQALETKKSSEYTEQDYATYHCDTPRKIHISHLDPSMLLGFYCRTRGEFDDFCARVMKVAKKYTPIFTIDEQAPEYDDDVRSEDDFGVLSGEEGLEGEEDEGEHIDVEEGEEDEGEHIDVEEGEEDEGEHTDGEEDDDDALVFDESIDGQGEETELMRNVEVEKRTEVVETQAGARAKTVVQEERAIVTEVENE